MSKIECHCETCGLDFQRVVLQGGHQPMLVCPECGGRQVSVAKRIQRLFRGISNFSALARDTN